MSEYERWETRFGAPDYVFGRAPNYFLVRCRPLLPASGRVLTVADGEGRNGVWLAELGLDVHAIDFSPAAQAKAAELARERNVTLTLELADMHRWAYPADTYDVVVEIFAQVNTPPERGLKWAGMKHALKPGGLLILMGYTPKQLDYGTGGPKQLENLYTRALLTEAFGDFRDCRFTEEELEMQEGAGHAGMSVVIGLTARKPD